MSVVATAPDPYGNLRAARRLRSAEESLAILLGRLPAAFEDIEARADAAMADLLAAAELERAGARRNLAADLAHDLALTAAKSVATTIRGIDGG